MDLSARQLTEIEFWRDSKDERPEANSLDNIINKVSEAAIFVNLLSHFKEDFSKSSSILELGSGQGWGSCIVKRLYPQAFVMATDISQYAVASVAKWEYIYQTKIDATDFCTSYEIPVADNSQDLVFCFAAAHHFVAHRRTFAELNRVLRPGGVCLYLYEPSCQAFMHKMAHKRVNMKRPEVPEDVLVYPKMQKLADEAGFSTQLHFYPSVRYRSPGTSIYYLALSRVPILQRLLPCTINYRFQKR